MKHSNDLIEENNTAAREKSSKIMAELEASLQVCRDSVRHRKCQVESFAEQRKDVLQFNRTNLFEHQEAMTDCVNDIKVRKDEVIEEQDSLLSKLDEIVESVLPRMTNATNSKQLIEVNKDVLARFHEIKEQMKQTVAQYSSWSYGKGDEVKKSNKDCLKGSCSSI